MCEYESARSPQPAARSPQPRRSSLGPNALRYGFITLAVGLSIATVVSTTGEVAGQFEADIGDAPTAPDTSIASLPLLPPTWASPEPTSLPDAPVFADLEVQRAVECKSAARTLDSGLGAPPSCADVFTDRPHQAGSNPDAVNLWARQGGLLIGYLSLGLAGAEDEGSPGDLASQKYDLLVELGTGAAEGLGGGVSP